MPKNSRSRGTRETLDTYIETSAEAKALGVVARHRHLQHFGRTTRKPKCHRHAASRCARIWPGHRSPSQRSACRRAHCRMPRKALSTMGCRCQGQGRLGRWGDEWLLHRSCPSLRPCGQTRTSVRRFAAKSLRSLRAVSGAFPDKPLVSAGQRMLYSAAIWILCLRTRRKTRFFELVP